MVLNLYFCTTDQDPKLFRSYIESITKWKNGHINTQGKNGRVYNVIFHLLLDSRKIDCQAGGI